jgi:hypothetical protein
MVKGRFAYPSNMSVKWHAHQKQLSDFVLKQYSIVFHFQCWSTVKVEVNGTDKHDFCRPWFSFISFEIIQLRIAATQFSIQHVISGFISICCLKRNIKLCIIGIKMIVKVKASYNFWKWRSVLIRFAEDPRGQDRTLRNAHIKIS